VTVHVDNERGMHALAEHHMVPTGVSRAAFVSGFPDSPDSPASPASMARGAAFARAVAELGGSCEPLDGLVGDWTSSGAEVALRRRLGTAVPPGARIPKTSFGWYRRTIRSNALEIPAGGSSA
jgi:DNA-binding LacI/PurR family transcriptional regulator